jgi:hypothetical protein
VAVDVFAWEESISLLGQWNHGVSERDAGRIAAALDDVQLR